jgi:hypothetical protein
VSVLYPGDRERREYLELGACHYCGEPAPVQDVAVYWQCTGTELLLHTACARDLGAHLIADSREAQLASGAPHSWHQRAARCALEPLYRSERAQGTTLPLRAWKGEPSLLPDGDSHE